MLKLAPSILAADFSKLGDEIKAVSDAGAHAIHIDVMDGVFVPSISFGMPVIEAVRKTTMAEFDVHLMIKEPVRYIADFVNAGADMITVHAEACTHLDSTLMKIKSYGKKAGIVLNPATPLSVLEYELDKIDMVLLMTVNPGFGGQKYISRMTDKVAELRKIITDRDLDIDLEVDGGITLDNVREVLEAGANVFVAGSSVFRGNAAENVTAFLKIFEEYEK